MKLNGEHFLIKRNIMAKERILITGGAGFIGSNLATYHLEEGNEVWIVDNLQTGKMTNIEKFIKQNKLRFDLADLRNWDLLETAVKWADSIFHLAANVGQKLILSNSIDTLNNNIYSFDRILEAMCKSHSSARLLLTSTSEIYCYSHEDEKGTVGEKTRIEMVSGEYLQATYPMSKFMNELSLLSYAHEKGIHGVIARLFNSIGKNQSPMYGFVVPRFISQGLSGKPITVFGDGLQTRAFSDVRDTVKMLSLLLKCDAARGEIVNVGNNSECTILQLAELIRQKTGMKSPITFVSYQEAYGVPFHDVRRRHPNLTKLESLIGYTPKISLEDTIDFILEQTECISPAV